MEDVMTTRTYKPKFFSGWKRILLRFPFFLTLGKYLMNKKRFPLFYLRSSKSGFLKTMQIDQSLGLNKTISFNGSYYTNLNHPHYPSKAYDAMVARGGLNLGANGTPQKGGNDNVILGITANCSYQCSHCYARPILSGDDIIPLERWKEVLRNIQQMGVNVIILSGGEPMLRFDRVMELLIAGNKDRSDFHLHTSGLGVTQERAFELKKAGLIAAAVGLDDVNPERHETMRGSPGSFARAISALRYFNNAGIMTYVNVCLSKAFVRSGDLWRYYDLMKDLNVSIIQLLEPRPCGGNHSVPMNDLFTEEDRAIVTEFYLKGNSERKYRHHPLLYYIAYMESPEKLGCLMGGLSHYYIDSAGNVNPCVFVPVSFGNILHEKISDIFARMRVAVPGPIHTECPSIRVAEILEEQGAKNLPIPFTAVDKSWNKIYNRAPEKSTGAIQVLK
jgi:MoaA/NifB/PqqE/SkfB family radical SAM enzyme